MVSSIELIGKAFLHRKLHLSYSSFITRKISTGTQVYVVKNSALAKKIFDFSPRL